MSEPTEKVSTDFIREIVNQDIASGKYKVGDIRTRFPPEPNGYLHIGHAKALWIDFGVARDYKGKTMLRMDDTNPVKEDVEYVDAIKEDIHWMGFDWEGDVRYASDYFEKMYEYAVLMIEKGLAYVDDQTADQIRETRGTLTEPGKESPWRNRSVEENLDLFKRMRAGEFADGEKVLRAKIDMASPNINFRDPVMYRILHATHHRTGDKWCIYPMYDWAHGLEDSIEGITHSLCTLEFEIHRPLYNWFLEQLPVHRPQQIEFSRLNLTYTVMSKRKLLKLVQEKHVNGWDDPRMPTICGFRRRGYTPTAIMDFLGRGGITKFNGIIDIALLENSLREELNKTASRYMGVLNPLKVVLTNYPEGQIEWLEAVNNPEDPAAGTRKLPFGREFYIDRDDFLEVPPPKYYNAPDGRKVKGTIQWVEATNAIDAEIRQYDRLFTKEDPDDLEEGQEDFLANLNPDSLHILHNCKLEPALGKLTPETRVQLERVGYFCADRYDYSPEHPVFNLTVSLKDSWAKIEKKEEPAKAAPKAEKKAEKKAAEQPVNVAVIGVEDFAKLQLKVAKVLEAERVENADKLLKLQVDCGEKRQIVAGVAAYYKPEEIVGKLIVMVVNLKPAVIRGIESNGMLLAAKKKNELRLLTVDGDIVPGASIG